MVDSSLEMPSTWKKYVVTFLLGVSSLHLAWLGQFVQFARSNLDKTRLAVSAACLWFNNQQNMYCWEATNRNKNAFPMGCVGPSCWPYPSMHCAWGVYLPGGGVPAAGCTCLGRYLPRGCTCPGGLYLPRGCTCLGGACPRGVPAQVLPPLWTDRHLWKHNLRKLHLRAVNIVNNDCRLK